MDSEQTIWVASTRPDGRPHLIPIWFAFVDDRFYVCTASSSVKVRNMLRNDAVSVSLESGNGPVIAEGTARILSRPYPPTINDAFVRKFEWDLDSEPEYDALIEITPHRWLRW